MESFTARIEVGKTDDGLYVGRHDTATLKFCFLAETETELLAKIDKALALYLKHKADKTRLKAKAIAFDKDSRIVERNIPLEANA